MSAIIGGEHSGGCAAGKQETVQEPSWQASSKSGT
jgi:hypothetical protein